MIRDNEDQLVNQLDSMTKTQTFKFEAKSQVELSSTKTKDMKKSRTSVSTNPENFDNLAELRPKVEQISMNEDDTTTNKNSNYKKKHDGLRDSLRCKWMIINPYNRYKQLWDVFATIALITTCIITPVDLAFFTHSATYPHYLV